MLPLLEAIDPTDLSVANIERLVRLGLAAPAELSHIAEYVNSVSPLEKHDIASPADVVVLKQYLEESGHKALFYNPTFTGYSMQSRPSTSSVLNHDIVKTWGDMIMSYTSNIETFDSLKAKGYNVLITTVPYTRLFREQDKLGEFALAADKVIYLNIINDNSNNTNKR
jgi:hypothetical protein